MSQFCGDVYKRGIDKCNILSGSRVLLLERDEVLADVVKNLQPASIVDFMEDIGWMKLLADNDVRMVEAYDYIIDGGFFAKSGWNVALVRALGLHLRCFGSMILFLPDWDSVMKANDILFCNWFGEVSLLEKLSVDGGEVESDIVYSIRAGSYNGQAAWLQSYFSDDIRKNISVLLTRLDFDIDVQENKKYLLELLKRHDVPANYIRVFVSAVCVDESKVLALLGLR